MRHQLLGLLLTGLSFTVNAQPQFDPILYIDSARTLFHQYSALYEKLDPGVLSLYADSASVTEIQVDETGHPDRHSYPFTQYRQQLQSELAQMKQQGERYELKKATYTITANGVEIETQRYSSAGDYTGEFSMVIGPVEGGQFKVLSQEIELKSLYIPDPEEVKKLEEMRKRIDEELDYREKNRRLQLNTSRAY